VDMHAAEGRGLSEEVEKLVADVHTLHQETRSRYYDLAIRITRELGHPFIADEILQCLYNEANAKANNGVLSLAAGKATPKPGDNGSEVPGLANGAAIGKPEEDSQ